MATVAVRIIYLVQHLVDPLNRGEERKARRGREEEEEEVEKIM